MRPELPEVEEAGARDARSRVEQQQFPTGAAIDLEFDPFGLFPRDLGLTVVPSHHDLLLRRSEFEQAIWLGNAKFFPIDAVVSGCVLMTIPLQRTARTNPAGKNR